MEAQLNCHIMDEWSCISSITQTRVVNSDIQNPGKEETNGRFWKDLKNLCLLGHQRHLSNMKPQNGDISGLAPVIMHCMKSACR